MSLINIKHGDLIRSRAALRSWESTGVRGEGDILKKDSIAIVISFAIYEARCKMIVVSGHKVMFFSHWIDNVNFNWSLVSHNEAMQ